MQCILVDELLPVACGQVARMHAVGVSRQLFSVVVFRAVGLRPDRVALLTVHGCIRIVGRGQAHVFLGDEVGEVGLHQCDAFRFATLLALLLLLLNDELLLTFGGLQQGATRHVPQLCIGHLLHFALMRAVYAIVLR